MEFQKIIYKVLTVLEHLKTLQIIELIDKAQVLFKKNTADLWNFIDNFLENYSSTPGSI